jgi:hypothetical protein
MTIIEAVKQAKESGKALRRKDWNIMVSVVIAWGEFWAKRYDAPGPPKNISLTPEDVLADDWLLKAP